MQQTPNTDHLKQPEELVGREFEVQQLVNLNDYVWQMANRDQPGDTLAADRGIDYMYEYCEALARRDPEIGHMLVSAFEAQYAENGNDDGAHIHSRLREVLGLPRADLPLPPDHSQ